MIVLTASLLFLPLTASTTNHNNALAQSESSQDDERQIYERDLATYRACVDAAMALNAFSTSFGAAPPADLSDCVQPTPPPQPQFQGPCAAWQTKWSDGSCVPSSCSTGQRNADGSCVPPPCPPVAPDVRDPHPRNVNRDLNDPHVNPEMRFHLENALRAARAAGLNPEVSEAYRTPDRSQMLYEESVRKYEEKRADLMAQIDATDDPAEKQKLNTQLQKLKRPPAAGAWSSGHNYGMAVDIRLRDAQGNILTGDSPATGSAEYEQLVPFMQAEGFAWYGPRDSGHYEYHPNWAGREGGVVGGPFLKGERDKAIVDEIARRGIPGLWWFNPMPVDWLSKMWNNAGARCSR